ncbi:MAG: hypothetical protein ACKVP4_12060 [Hyphomicrobium sp.]
MRQEPHNKRIFSVIVEPVPFSELPMEMTAEWQIVDLSDAWRCQLHKDGKLQPSPTFPSATKTSAADPIVAVGITVGSWRERDWI